MNPSGHAVIVSKKKCVAFYLPLFQSEMLAGTLKPALAFPNLFCITMLFYVWSLLCMLSTL